MQRIGEGGDLVKCSFCGENHKHVKKMIAGPGVYIVTIQLTAGIQTCPLVSSVRTSKGRRPCLAAVDR